MISPHPTNPTRVFTIYLLALSILGAALVYIATSRLGPGISTDSAMIMSTASNLLQGRGLIDYRGVPLTQFPPLYSIILAFGSLIISRDIFIVGWVLNILVFSALIWFSGQYFYETFNDEPILAYFGSFVIFSSTSLIQISSNIATDPFFLLLVIIFLMLMTRYLKSGSNRLLWVSAFLTIFACYYRYAGLALVLAGGLILIYRNRSNPLRAVLTGGLYSVLTAIPIFLWGYLHNAPVNRTVFGGRLPAIPALNFITGVEKVLYWFMPYSVISLINPLLLLFVALVLIALVIWRTSPPDFLKKMTSPSVLPNIAFLVVYIPVLIFDISYYELKGINTDRVHIIALPSVLIILMSVGELLIKEARHRFGKLRVYVTAILLFAIWAVYPISRAYQYVSQSAEHGEISSYNSVNKMAQRSSSFSAYIEKLDVQGKPVYSNGTDLAWFILRTQIHSLPGIPADKSYKQMAYLLQHYPGWPGPGNDGYLIWFNSEAYKDFLPTPHELTAITDINQLYSDADGSVYYIKSP